MGKSFQPQREPHHQTTHQCCRLHNPTALDIQRRCQRLALRRGLIDRVERLAHRWDGAARSEDRRPTDGSHEVARARTRSFGELAPRAP